MNRLPLHDTPMLMSAINFLLYDEEFDDLDQICYHFNVDKADLEKRLAAGKFQYSAELNRVW